MDTNSLDQRVARLESSARRWRMTAIGLGGALAGLMIAGAGSLKAPPSEVRVMNWGELVGQNGAFSEDGSLRTKTGSVAVNAAVQGGTLDEVKAVTKVDGQVTVNGAPIPGMPRGR